MQQKNSETKILTKKKEFISKFIERKKQKKNGKDFKLVKVTK